jgi:hypothetical protein
MITSALCNSFKLEALQGIHDAGDQYKIALYLNGASLGKATKTYTTDHETKGAGYAAGGIALSGYDSGLIGDTAFITWADALWPVCSITARGCLIYNASKGNKAVAVFDFGNDYTAINGSFVATLPKGDAPALVRVT